MSWINQETIRYTIPLIFTFLDRCLQHLSDYKSGNINNTEFNRFIELEVWHCPFITIESDQLEGNRSYCLFIRCEKYKYTYFLDMDFYETPISIIKEDILNWQDKMIKKEQ